MNESSHPESPQGGVRMLLLGGANFIFLTSLAICVLLKEHPLFWQNAGGWPVGLRELVKFVFYPLWFLELAALLGFSWTGLRYRSAPRELAVCGIALTLIFWLAFLLIGGLLIANNLENIFLGRPLHWHVE